MRAVHSATNVGLPAGQLVAAAFALELLDFESDPDDVEPESPDEPDEPDDSEPDDSEPEDSEPEDSLVGPLSDAFLSFLSFLSPESPDALRESVR